MRELIFISYRREDTSGEARSIYERPDSPFGGHLFMDVDSITRGRDFGLVLTETLKRCSVMLVLVGMPKADELPDDLKPLAMRQAAIITHENFSGDMDRIEQDLRPLLPKFAFFLTVVKVIAVLVLLFSVWLWWPGG
jgi:hypothetical protein